MQNFLNLLKPFIPYLIRLAEKLLLVLLKKIQRRNVKMSFKITVQNSAGTALQGASVAYEVDGSTSTKTTDSNGLVEIDGLAAGTYKFTATLDGYTSNSTDFTSIDESTELTGTIALTATTTQGESNVSTITDAAKTAAVAAVTTALTNELSDTVSTTTANASTGLTSELAELIQKGTNEVTRLSKEIGTTHSWYVKLIRNPAEIVVLTGLIAGVGAGVTDAIKELTEKVG